MNAPHFHMVVNHFPILVPIIAILVLIGGFIVKSDIVKRTAYLLFVLGAAFTFLAMNSGDQAERAVEHLNGISESFIHTHEEIAEKFAPMHLILGLLALVALWANWKKKKFAALMSFFVLGYALVIVYYAKQVGTTGGEIRHTEIRDGASTSTVIQAAPTDGDDD